MFDLQAYPTTVPVYTLVLALVIPAIYMLPAGLIYAVTGMQVSMLPRT